MELELDHFFILVEPGGKVADALVSLGMQEDFSRVHEGQGTTNRRFPFGNRMLEIIWVHDAEEAQNGPGRDLRFVGRANNPDASPFGVILRRKNNTCLDMPFDGWKYQPAYFKPPWAFHVGANADKVYEPLCIYVPFIEPKTEEQSATGNENNHVFQSITHIAIYLPSMPASGVLNAVDAADGLSIHYGEEHFMEVTFDGKRQACSEDFRPDIPLRLCW
ncbi:hypothetical protein A9Q81_21775 [Gammaproteobacteria bacterium 42_54_T18]|nr:hypothetical protein A9Q81_21775 [Gammaproteobacteria bacterium 42_54_T18]